MKMPPKKVESYVLHSDSYLREARVIVAFYWAIATRLGLCKSFEDCISFKQLKKQLKYCNFSLTYVRKWELEEIDLVVQGHMAGRLRTIV